LRECRRIAFPEISPDALFFYYFRGSGNANPGDRCFLRRDILKEKEALMVGREVPRPPRILVSDDEKDLVEMLAFSLGRKVYEVASAYDRLEAWERMKKERFDLLILDLMMPGLDGWEVCRFIRENNDPQIREAPILILSARVMAEDRVRDNGRGIFPAEKQQIFSPFYRGKNALNEPGMGLGLSLVKEVMDLHGGEVRVRSEPGKGSVFSLVFPCSRNVFSEKEVRMAS